MWELSFNHHCQSFYCVDSGFKDSLRLRPGTVTHACGSSHVRSHRKEDHGLRSALSKNLPEKNYQKKTKQNRAEGVAQVSEHLPGKCEALHSKPQYWQKKKKKVFGIGCGGASCDPSRAGGRGRNIVF
jgi:hypothetical protein